MLSLPTAADAVTPSSPAADAVTPYSPAANAVTSSSPSADFVTSNSPAAGAVTHFGRASDACHSLLTQLLMPPLHLVWVRIQFLGDPDLDPDPDSDLDFLLHEFEKVQRSKV